MFFARFCTVFANYLFNRNRELMSFRFDRGDLISGPFLAMFPTERTERTERYFGSGADVANRKARHGQCKVALLRQGRDRGMPKTLSEDIHERVVFVVERFQRGMFVTSERRPIGQMFRRRYGILLYSSE